MKITYLSIALLLLLPSCGTPDRPMNLTDAKKQVQRYYEHGDYYKDLDAAITRATNHFQNVPVDDRTVVIFDIDETSLTDYPDTKSISFGYIPKLSHEWVLEADAPAIPQVKKLYDFLVGRGFKIIFLTGRKHDEHAATIKNLKREGYTEFDKLIVRQPEERKITAKAYKSARRKQLTKEGYHIVGCVGDQESDLTGDNTGYEVKLPNYIYRID
ncbi:HAD family acid phosphatase [Candidatus Dependentiae bacterium]